jgi:hypothetical protein
MRGTLLAIVTILRILFPTVAAVGGGPAAPRKAGFAPGATATVRAIVPQRQECTMRSASAPASWSPAP